jgi:hypothetical protein
MRNMLACSKSLLIASLGGLFFALAYAETILPGDAKYEVEVKEDQAAKSCNLMLLLLNIPSPETVNFRLITAQQKSDGRTFVGFSVDVGDLRFANGVPAGSNKAVLSSAAFISPSFSSVGRFNGGPTADGGVLEMTTDPVVYSQYTMAFLSGGFQIHFERKGVPGTRTYDVKQQAPANVVAQFAACVSSLKQ